MHKTPTKHGNDGDPLFLIGWSADVLSISCFCKYVLCVCGLFTYMPVLSTQSLHTRSRVLTIYLGKPETPVGKSNSSRYSIWVYFVAFRSPTGSNFID